MVRYGNCYGDTDLLNGGAFLDTVIPEPQYITGKTGYVLHHLNNWIMVNLSPSSETFIHVGEQ